MVTVLIFLCFRFLSLTSPTSHFLHPTSSNNNNMLLFLTLNLWIVPVFIFFHIPFYLTRCPRQSLRKPSRQKWYGVAFFRFNCIVSSDLHPSLSFHISCYPVNAFSVKQTTAIIPFCCSSFYKTSFPSVLVIFSPPFTWLPAPVSLRKTTASPR